MTRFNKKYLLFLLVNPFSNKGSSQRKEQLSRKVSYPVHGKWVYLHVFLPSLQRGTTFVTIYFLPWCVFSKWGLLLKEGICSMRSKFFSLIVDLHEEGKQNSNSRVLAPLSVTQLLFEERQFVQIRLYVCPYTTLRLICTHCSTLFIRL